MGTTRKGLYKDCPVCGENFYAPKWLLERQHGGKYCSKKCYWLSKLGSTPWNKGVKGSITANSGSFTSAETAFKKSIQEYKRLHYIVRKLYGSPEECEFCGATGKIEWANKSGDYREDRDDWLHLCRKCHFEYDKVEARRAKNAGN